MRHEAKIHLTLVHAAAEGARRCLAAMDHGERQIVFALERAAEKTSIAELRIMREAYDALSSKLDRFHSLVLLHADLYAKARSMRAHGKELELAQLEQ